MLESPRVITDGSGNIVSRRDFMPFGEEITGLGGRSSSVGYNPDTIRQKFTGYEKDDETGLDFAEARYYNSRNGRFTAVDPLLASGKSANPQTFNRYSYSLNSPLVMSDPSGMQTGSQLEPMGSWYKPNEIQKGQDYKRPRFVGYDEKAPKNYTLMSPEDHVYFNSERANTGEKNVWTMLHPHRLDSSNFETKEVATKQLYSMEPNFDPSATKTTDTANSLPGYLNLYGGATSPGTGGFGLAGGTVLDFEQRQVLPQAGIVWSFPPGPVANATYSPFSASDGLNVSGSASIGVLRGTAGSISFDRHGTPAIEGGAGSPGITVGLFYVYRPSRQFYYDNTSSSEQGIRNQRKRLGFEQPSSPCFSMRCNSNSNSNSQ